MALRLRLFNRIPYPWATGFALTLAAVQILEHTNMMFVCCTFVYILMATTAFNIADGLTTLPGNFVFGTAVLTFVLGVTVKALIGEAGESILKNGVATAEVYVMGMLAILAATIVEKSLRAKRPLISTALKMTDPGAAYVGCAIVGVAADVLGLFSSGSKNGSLSSLFGQLNHFAQFAIILGTIQVVRRSRGQSNLSPSLTGERLQTA